LAIVRAFPKCGFSGSSSDRPGAEPHFGKMGTMGNRHLGHHFCILACFTSSFRVKGKNQSFAGGLDLGNEKYCSFVNQS
jgi:hypothetical protein